MEGLVYDFIFLDVVGLSNPALSTEMQIDKINILNEKIKECKTFKGTTKEKKKILPTGDGAAIGFKHEKEDDIYLPLDLAKELHQKLNEYNSGKQWLQQILLHIGIHSERVLPFKDLNGEDNVWGEGIIIAHRIMSYAPAGFILLSEEIGQRLSKSMKYKKIIYHAGFIQLKYQQQFVWYAYDDDFGRNDISEIKNLVHEFSEFSAEVVDKKQYKLGESVKIKVDFTGKLKAGLFTIMLRAPKKTLFPTGEPNKWFPAKETISSSGGGGNLSGNIAKIVSWNFQLEENFPKGVYTVYIRVYDYLEEGRRIPVIREKVESIFVV